MDSRVREYVAPFNTERPHQSPGNRPLPTAGQPEPLVLRFPERGVVCQRRLSGLLKHYRRVT